MQSLYYKIGGDHTAAEQHGEQHTQKNQLAAPQAGFGKGIRHQRGKEQIDDGAHHRYIDGDQHAPEQSVRGENITVGRQGPFLRPKNQPALGHLRRAGKRHGQYINKRQNTDGRDQN
ncbi:hypothetical protein D3C81_2009640 [compost metagenome]